MPSSAERHLDSLSDASVEEAEEEEEEEEDEKARGGEEGEEEGIEEEVDEEVEELEEEVEGEEEEGNESEGQEEVEEMEEAADGKTLEEHDKKVSDVNGDDLRSTVLEKNVISSGQESIPKSLIGNKNDEALLGNRISGESKDIASLDASENEAAADDRPKNGLNGKPEVVIENEEPCLQTHKEFQPPEEVHMTSIQTLQRRPRSSSPDAALENANKRAKVICAFFARGWCIKGNSCTFLHQKDGVVSTSQWTKEEPSGPSRKGDFLAKSGPRQEAERLKPSSSNDALASSNVGSASNSPFSLQRALVRAYGGENHRLHQLPDNYGPHKSPNASGPLDREEYRGPGNASLQEKFRHHFDSIDDRHSASKEFIFRKYMGESRLQHGMPEGDCMYDVPCSRGSPLTRNGIVTEHRLYSSGLSTAPSLNQKLGNYYAFERKMEEPVPKDQQSNVPSHDSKSSFGLDSSLNSSFTDPLRPVHVSALDNCQSGAPTHGSALHAFERLDIHGISEFDKGYYGSRSTPLLRNSSPYYSRPKLGTTAQHNVPGDLTDSAVLKTHFQTDAWEPSVPFRSSFCSIPDRISSPGSHYDPLLDSIEPSTAGTVNSQTSHRSIVDCVTSQHIDGNPILNKDPSPAYNSQVHPNSFSQPHELFEGKNTSAQRLSGLVTASGPSTGDGKSSIPKKEKSWIPSYVAAGANVSQGDGANTQVDKGRNSKESKSVKIFRAALVEFLKELVKPSWREGHLSKDAHKMVVRKAVEKVLSALQPHQIPSTMESVNQYLSSSRPKLMKLVEGYVEKYAKAGASNVKAV